MAKQKRKVRIPCPKCSGTVRYQQNYANDIALTCPRCGGETKVVVDEGSSEHLAASTWEYADKKGCFITTATLSALNKPDDCEELNTFRKFRDTYVRLRNPEAVAEYYHCAPLIVEEINKTKQEAEVFNSIWENDLYHIYNFIQGGESEKAFNLYEELILRLKAKYLS